MVIDFSCICFLVVFFIHLFLYSYYVLINFLVSFFDAHAGTNCRDMPLPRKKLPNVANYIKSLQNACKISLA